MPSWDHVNESSLTQTSQAFLSSQLGLSALYLPEHLANRCLREGANRPEGSADCKQGKMFFFLFDHLFKKTQLEHKSLQGHKGPVLDVKAESSPRRRALVLSSLFSALITPWMWVCVNSQRALLESISTAPAPWEKPLTKFSLHNKLVSLPAWTFLSIFSAHSTGASNSSFPVGFTCFATKFTLPWKPEYLLHSHYAISAVVQKKVNQTL